MQFSIFFADNANATFEGNCSCSTSWKQEKTLKSKQIPLRTVGCIGLGQFIYGHCTDYEQTLQNVWFGHWHKLRGRTRSWEQNKNLEVRESGMALDRGPKIARKSLHSAVLSLERTQGIYENKAFKNVNECCRRGILPQNCLEEREQWTWDASRGRMLILGKTF